ncbi:hypothetical protein M2266_004823 [Streptomyces sp. SPB162]|nr:hypothetical protein [Streptomyces sp. SPB162]
MRSLTSSRARVVRVEHRAGARDVVDVVGGGVPRQFEHRVQPGADPAALRRGVGGALQLLDLLEGRLADLLRQVGGLDTGAVVPRLVLRLTVQLGQLLADRVQLLAEQELALRLLHPLLHVLADGVRDVLLGEVVAQRADGEPQPPHRVAGLQQLHALLGRQERGVAGVVRELRDVLDLLHPVHDLPGAALAQPAGGQRLVLLDELGDGAGRLGDRRLLDLGRLHPQRGTGPGGPGPDPHPGHTADDRAGVSVGQPADLLDRAERADRGVRAVDPRNKQHLRLALTS